MGVWKEGENIGILENVVGILTIYVMYNAGESSVKKIGRIYHFAMDMHKGQSESSTLDDVMSIVRNINDWADENEKLEIDLFRKNLGMTKNALADNLNDVVNSEKSDPKLYEAGRELLISIMEEMEFIAKIDGDDLNKTTQSFLDWLANRWEFEVSIENREFLTKDDIPSDMKEILEESDLEWDVAIVSESDKTPKTGKQISTDDQVADSATVKTENQEEKENIMDVSNWTQEFIDSLLKKDSVIEGKDEDLLKLIISHPNTDPRWYEEIALVGFKSPSLILELIKIPNLDSYILSELYERDKFLNMETTDWREIDCEILNHPNCPADLKKSKAVEEAPDEETAEEEIPTEKPTETEPVEPAAANEKKDKEKPPTQKKRTLQGQLADEIVKLYPNAEVKKIDKGTYLDIHLPDVHSKRGTHLWFNTPKAGGIKLGFFCRDAEFNNKVVSENSSSIEQYSNGVRPLGFPTFKKVDDAIKVAQSFINNLKN